MRKKSFWTKTDALLLLLSVLFVLLMYLSRADAGPVSQTDNFTVTAQRGITRAVVPETKEEKVNVNTAGVEELQTLYGIGEVKAQAIVEDREANGQFTCAEDLLRVSGIGEKTLENIKDDITWEVTP